jgi:hypothetical protein
MRPSGICARSASRFAASFISSRLMAVAIAPGAMPFTVIPVPRSSTASVRVSIRTPPFAAQ